MFSANFGLASGILTALIVTASLPFMRGEPFLKGLRQGRPTPAQISEPRHAVGAC